MKKTLFGAVMALAIFAANQVNASEIHEVVKWGHITTLKRLLQDPHVDLNAKNKDGFTPLMLAVVKYNQELSQLISSVQSFDKIWNWGAPEHYTEIINLLLPISDIMATKPDGKTVVDLANGNIKQLILDEQRKREARFEKTKSARSRQVNPDS